MDNEGQEGGALPGMGDGGGAPIGEENTTRMIGRLTRKPFVTEVTGGHKKALFTLMVPRSYRDGEGKRHRNVAFVPVTAWRALAAQVEPLGKDSAVLVEGHLRSWSDPKGKSFRLEVEAEVLEVLERREPAKDEGRKAPAEGATAHA